MGVGDTSTERTERLQTYFEKSAAAVAQLFDRIDRNYIQPGAARVTKSFAEQPIPATFLVTFATISFLPIFAFVGFSVFAIGACTFLALAAALVVSSAAIAFIGFWLGLTLVLIFFVSLFITTSLVSTYLFLRYVTLVRGAGPRAGSVQWAREVKNHVRGGKIKAELTTQEEIFPSHTHEVSGQAHEVEEHAHEIKEETHSDSDGSGVDDTTVVIGEDSPDQRFSFKELDDRETAAFVKPQQVVITVVKQPEVVDAL